MGMCCCDRPGSVHNFGVIVDGDLAELSGKGRELVDNDPPSVGFMISDRTFGRHPWIYVYRASYERMNRLYIRLHDRNVCPQSNCENTDGSYSVIFRKPN